MTSGYIITIFFKDGHTEKHYCDYYQKMDSILIYYVRFGENSGQHCIPYDLIKEFVINN